MKPNLRVAADIRETLAGRHHTDSTELLRDDRSSDNQYPVERELALETLLADVTEENRHVEIDLGPTVGDEKW